MAKAEPIQLPVSALRLGLTIKLPLSWADHPFLRNRIEIKEPAQIEMIRGLNVPYVILLDGQELLEADNQEAPLEVPEEIEPQLQEPDVRKETRKAIRLSQKRFIECVNNSRSLFSKITSDPEGAYRLAATLVEDMLVHLLEVETPYLALVSLGEQDGSVTQHGISVAVLSLMIAKALDLPKKDMRDMALGALLHDIGKLKVPDIIRRKRTGLTPTETRFMQQHPNFGYEMLSRSGLFPPEVLQVVKHHHEYIDGSGFPDGLKGKKIPIITQIVSLANDFDSQLSSQKLISPQLALGYLFKNHSDKHAETLISVLVKVLGIYPPGTLVRLSDGSVGKVMMTTKEVRQPQVWACEPNGANPALRLLSEEPVTVDQVIKAEELHEAALRVLQADSAINFYFSAMQG
ncbi:HD-GYP domain-containing protein [Shewanella sedimentimangrovi]|uniref:DUF3391 domain-containing protein n=1 Tax=Shewanella sedimentimangrovi TaxID=2814293 RepID=A0ABX7QYE8_9GAMM|nr:HD-GYP domain-containing protein [Shewanella sedimentimangrovi]QSX35880.1 DUF3391 domain-containing protein [Shewanella sedimentimangrovi]